MNGEKWALYVEARGWLVDDCATGSWDHNVDQAKWFDSKGDAIMSMGRVGVLPMEKPHIVRVK